VDLDKIEISFFYIKIYGCTIAFTKPTNRAKVQSEKCVPVPKIGTPISRSSAKNKATAWGHTRSGGGGVAFLIKNTAAAPVNHPSLEVKFRSRSPPDEFAGAHTTS
jgi:hypothetical protein